MDFGLTGFTRALTLPTLDKRDATQEAAIYLDADQGVLILKCGKIDIDGASNEEISAGVEIHPCRE